MKALVHCWVRRLTHPSRWFHRTDAIAFFDSYTEGIVPINDAMGEGFAYRVMRDRADGDADAAGVINVGIGTEVEPLTMAQIRAAIETLESRSDGPSIWRF